MPSRVVTASGGKPTGREPANGILTGADIMSQALPFSCATFAQRNALGNKLRRRDWALAATYLAAYVVLAWVSFIHTYRGVPITPWDPGLGAVFALMMRLGPVAGVVLFAGVVIADVLVLGSDVERPIVLGIAAITALSFSAVVAWGRRKLKIDTELVHLRDVLMLLAIGLLGATMDTILLTVFLQTVGHLDSSDAIRAFAPLLIGDTIGIAVMTPLLLRFAFRRRHIDLRRLPSIAVEVILYLCMIGAALSAILGESAGSQLFYLLFVPVVIAAVRHGLDGACFSLAIVQFGLIGILQLSGYDAAKFTEFQTLMLVLTVTGLIVGVVVSERENLTRIAREAQTRLIERQAEAAQVERLNLVTGMASALAHEINQPMTAARALGRSAQHLIRNPGSDLSRAGNNLTAMLVQIDHAGAIVARMREFIRRGRPRVSTIKTRDMLEQALTLALAEASAKQVRLELDAPDNLPDLHGDQIQLEQVVINLVHNAIEAITGTGQQQGHIRIIARQQEHPPGVEIGVLDNGPGIEPQLASRLFDPLATSKQEGLGLGLSISASIAESHGGRVWLHRADAGATEFRLSIPLNQMRAS
jgi:two-component system, LuxR family, sensor kinase FixL